MSTRPLPQPVPPAAGTPPAPKKGKRSTRRGEAAIKLIAALTKHHKYAKGSCLNLEPVGNNELARQADNPMLLAQLGYYRGRVGELDASLDYLDHALAVGADHVYVQYYRAVAASDRGDVDAALDAVDYLVTLGYPVALLRSAPEFGSLVGDDRFKALLHREDPA